MISIDQLKPCDILLCQGDSFISEMIIALDKGSYSHAAFYYGDGYVNHATKDGIAHQKLQDSLMQSEKHIDVYRFKKGAFQIGDLGWPATPLLSVAEYYVINHTAFAWDELFMLGFLSLTRDIDLPPEKASKLRKLLDSEAAKILEHFRDGKSMMICSEFVYHCYDDAGDQHQYTLTLNDVKTKTKMVTARTDSFYETRMNYIRQMQQVFPEHFKLTESNGAQGFIIPDFITPKDIATSTDLFKLDILK